MEEIPVTEQWLHIEALKEQVSGDGLPDKLSLLRQKPSQKAIPTVRDRVVQMATLPILEPIFEADFEDCSYGFGPGAVSPSLLLYPPRVLHLLDFLSGEEDFLRLAPFRGADSQSATPGLLPAPVSPNSPIFPRERGNSRPFWLRLRCSVGQVGNPRTDCQSVLCPRL